MQHTVELDNHLEQFLTDIATRLNKSKDDVLLIAINEYMQEKTRQAELEKFLTPYQLYLDGFKFDRELANER